MSLEKFVDWVFGAPSLIGYKDRKKEREEREEADRKFLTENFKKYKVITNSIVEEVNPMFSMTAKEEKAWEKEYFIPISEDEIEVFKSAFAELKPTDEGFIGRYNSYMDAVEHTLENDKSIKQGFRIRVMLKGLLHLFEENYPDFSDRLDQNKIKEVRNI